MAKKHCFVIDNKELIKEWDWEENSKKGFDPHALTCGSNKKVFWKCQRGHRWDAQIYSRAILHTGCKTCTKELKTSYPEKAIAFYISSLFTDTIENYRSKDLNNTELDIYIPSFKIGIEYDGVRWHKNSDKDLVKDQLCEKLGIYLIRVREIGCADYESKSLKIYLKPRIKGELNVAIEAIVSNLNKRFGLSLECNVDLNRDGPAIMTSVLTIKKENSILNSTFINEWSKEKNKDINPEYISLKSNNEYWWKCKTCNYEWIASPATRERGAGCPHCSGRVPMPGVDDLLTLYPKLCKKEWDYSKNKINPSEVLPGSGEKVWWKCSVCGHEWRTEVRVRALDGCGCKKCGHIKTGKSSSVKIKNIDTGIIYESVANASELLRISRTNIINCLKRRSKTAGGFHWDYADKKGRSE